MRILWRNRIMNVIVSALLVCAFFGIVEITKAQATTPLGDPLEEKAVSSLMLLSAEVPLAVPDNILEESEESDPPQDQKEEISNPDSFENSPSDSHNEHSEGDPSTADDGSDDGLGDGSGDFGSGAGGNIIAGGGEGDGAYFTTNIKDGATLDMPELSFGIYHTARVEQENLHYHSVEAVLNGREIEVLGDDIEDLIIFELSEGGNSLTLFVNYEQSNGNIKSVPSRQYTLYVKTKYDLSLETTLVSHTANASSITFEASLYCNGEWVLPQQTGIFVTQNGLPISVPQDDNGCFNDVQLTEGENIFVIGAVYKGKTAAQLTRTVIYAPDAPDPPVIDSDLTNDRQVVNPYLTIWVMAWDYENNYIDHNSITLMLNGRKITPAFQDGFTYYYDLEFQEGVNEVTITATDHNNVSTTVGPYMIEYTLAPPLQTTATISVEATTLGGPNGGARFQAPLVYAQVEPEEGINAVYDLTDVLEKNGFGYEYDGNAESGFRLKQILKNYINWFNNVHFYSIHADLLDYIKQDGLQRITSLPHDAIGEGYFYSGSMWLCQLNGAYLNPATTSLSDIYLQPGDVLRIRFSLAYGRDIGAGGLGLGTGAFSGRNYGDEW
ncbi:MAG: hypothetical protein ACOYJC_05965 [Christensenellales bacterium]|jgi:hypothetical protein